jgi:uncharacterized membrane protein YhaH (DUF805 family)
VTFKQSLTTCFRKYADFSGRASRSEFWYFSLFEGMVWATLAAVVVGLTALNAPNWVWWLVGFPLLLVLLALLVPGSAVQARRCHDTGRSMWTIARLRSLFEVGEPGVNRYGPRPWDESISSCPQCGTTVNRDLRHCPYCHSRLGTHT